MTKIIEELQARVADSKSRLDAATRDFQVAQGVFQQAQQNFNIWNGALQIELRDEQRRAAAAAENQLPLPTAPQIHKSAATQEAGLKQQEDFTDAPVDLVDDARENFNKTASVRNLLSHHPAGMTAVDIWNEVRADFKHRPYLYSVLKRLRDREEIIKRRNKYCLKLIPKAQEAQDQTVVH